jgi:hypothetical protein
VKYCPPDDPVFQLVPPEVGIVITTCYANLGEPIITRETVWDVYSSILDLLRRAVSLCGEGLPSTNGNDPSAAETLGGLMRQAVLMEQREFESREHPVENLVATSESEDSFEGLSSDDEDSIDERSTEIQPIANTLMH